jgi:hypothetical protein
MKLENIKVGMRLKLVSQKDRHYSGGDWKIGDIVLVLNNNRALKNLRINTKDYCIPNEQKYADYFEPVCCSLKELLE